MKSKIFFFKNYLYLLTAIIATLGIWNFTFNQKASAQNPDDFYLSYDTQGVISIPQNVEPLSYLSKTGSFDSAKVKVSIYQADKEDLLNYIKYNSDGDQINKFLNTQDLKSLGSFETILNSDNLTRVSLPIKDAGLYYLEFASERGVKFSSFYIITRYGTIATSGEDNLILWTQDFLTRKKVTDGKLTFYNLKNKVDKIDDKTPNDDGIIETDYNNEYDIALFEKNDDISLIKINRNYLNHLFNKNYYYSYFNKFSDQLLSFGYTERPIYKPGDKIFFKGIFRDDYNGKLSITKGNVNVKIYQSESSPILERTLSVNEYGSVDGEFVLPQDVNTGYYTIEFSKVGNYPNSYLKEEFTYRTSFQVDFYRKPSYFIEANTDIQQVTAGDKHKFNVKASYFSGNPVSGQKIKYKITNSSYYNFNYLNDRNLYPFKSSDTSFVYQGNLIKEGEAILNDKGTAEIEYDVIFPDEGNQIVQFEAELDDGTGNPAVSATRILAYRGDYDIFRNDNYQSSVQVGSEVNIPIKLIQNLNNNINLNNNELSVEIIRNWWEESGTSSSSYSNLVQREEFIDNFKFRTNQEGESVINFVPNKTGTYKLKINGTDGRGNTITNTLYLFVTENSNVTYFSESKEFVVLNLDKEEYKIGENVKLKISSEIPNIDVFVAYQRNKILRYEVITINGYSKELNFNIEKNDIPNLYVEAITYSNNTFVNISKNVKINLNDKKLDIKVTPDKTSYGPSDQISLNINVKDFNGNPAQTEVALWLVDKAIYELTGSQNYNIFDQFWYQRSNSTLLHTSLDPLNLPGGGGGGCFAEGTKILMSDNTYKNIEDIRIGDTVLTKESESSLNLVPSQVTQTFKHNVSGYLIINNFLRVTPEHIVYVNGDWKEAGSTSIGDKLVDNSGNSIAITSIEWVKGDFNVYNFTVENTHTYFAENIYVHNQKGSGPRSDFRDTAYWNPSVKTDSNGNAKVSFKLPDNLTTWMILSVGNTLSSQFGGNQTEIKVSKDIVISPVLPNILRESDEINLSALVQNFTDQEQIFNVSLKTQNAGTLDSPDIIEVSLKPREIKTISFRLKVGSPTEDAKFNFKLDSKTSPDNSDEVEITVPIREYGFYSYRSQGAEGNYNYQLKFSDKINPNKSSVKLALAPSILGKIPASFDYLLEYPFGCVEQTSSRIVPALLIKKYPQLYSQISSNNNYDKEIKNGVKRLNNLSNYNGWNFWNPTGEVDYFITANVLENLLEAKKLGYNIDENILSSSLDTMNNIANSSYSESTPDNIAYANYALALAGKYNQIYKLESDKFSQMSIDAISMNVMALYLAGEKNPEINGLKYLEDKAVIQGDFAYFEAGSEENFGSIDASTALAVRALTLTKENYDLALKAVKYLAANRGNNYYWTNTYGTAQAIRAISEFALYSNEENPNYSYEIKLDSNLILNGKVDSNKSIINDKLFETSEIKGGTSLDIIKNGEGKLYSNLIYKEFITDKNYKSSSEGLNVTREYVNTKGDIYNLGVGDIVDVTFKIKSNNTRNFYAVLVDELPAGLVPVNINFKNELFNRDETFFISNPFIGEISEYEYTENGVVLTLNDITNFEKTYTYKARVVSEGTFIAPPTFVSLMYNPNIKANTNTAYLTTYQETNTNYLKIVVNFFTKYILLILQIILGLTLLLILPIFLILRFIAKKKNMTIKELIKDNILKIQSFILNFKFRILKKLKKDKIE